MTIGTRLNPREVDTRVALLAVNVAGEVPVQISAVPGDRRVCRFGYKTTTALIDVLEKKGDIVAGRVPIPHVQGVLTSGPRPDGGVIEVGEVIVEAVDDDGGLLDFPGVISSRGRTANSECETECEETNSSHKGEDETEEADLLSPCPLLLGSSDTTSSE